MFDPADFHPADFDVAGASTPGTAVVHWGQSDDRPRRREDEEEWLLLQ